MDLKEEFEELKSYFSTLDIIGQRVMEKKVRELTYPSITSTCPPPMKYKPKRGNTKSKRDEEIDVHRDPSEWKYAEGS